MILNTDSVKFDFEQKLTKFLSSVLEKDSKHLLSLDKVPQLVEKVVDLNLKTEYKYFYELEKEKFPNLNSEQRKKNFIKYWKDRSEEQKIDCKKQHSYYLQSQLEISNNIFESKNVSQLKKLINTISPFIFCTNWTKIDCVDFLTNVQTNDIPEYRFHPLYFRWKNASVSQIQDFFGIHTENDKEKLLETVIENLKITDELWEQHSKYQELRYLSREVIIEKFKNTFPKMNIPPSQNDCIKCLVLFG